MNTVSAFSIYGMSLIIVRITIVYRDCYKEFLLQKVL